VGYPINNFAVIAEGIEKEEQLAFLKKNDCRTGQRYLFSRPIPAEQMDAYLSNRKSGIPII
jgi:EAL domain-containing protein (putative c-di-GMP-specific phosphodiesterase class I)